MSSTPLQKYFESCKKIFDVREKHVKVQQKDVDKTIMGMATKATVANLWKLGGKKKNKWEQRTFKLDQGGLTWCAACGSVCVRACARGVGTLGLQ